MKKIYQVDEKIPASLFLPLSLQHTFAMFGASVLVPIIFQINPGIVLLMNGIGTLLFILIGKGKAPAYLGSSFAFLGPAGLIISSMGFQYALGAFVVTGLLGCLIALIIYKFGSSWIDIILPPAAMGSVVALIGFELVSLTVRGGNIGANIMTDTVTTADITVFFITLGVAVFGSVLFRGFFSTIPILIAIIAGYTASVFFGLIDFTPIKEAGLFTLPHFQLPKFDIKAILTMLPVLLVITSEHISHQVVTSNIIKRDLIKDPGLHRTIFADNFSTALSGMVGGVPTTTYGENIGVMAVTGVYSVYVIGGAAVISILMAFISPLAAVIQTIPGDVIGGVTFLLYGMIGASGIRLLVDSKIDYSKPKNLMLTSVVFTTGLSGVSIRLGQIEFKGMVLASAVAVLMSLIFYIFEKINALE
ncbi:MULTISPECIES: uracil permease [unclassified Treponema]|uniref:uracil permease n=1 Tax=unclassified Treponema TaxID=2638727 RepID=UPI0005300DC0|nr:MULTISPECIES: uracil permease [unclassified Treponema]AIW88578.1 uracil permease [Treponema sp. OMZ 838]UTC51417.1 uracil permease [Treponema sp. OMZ 855]